MNTRTTFFGVLLLLALAPAFASRPLAGADFAVKPYRVLLVIGDQWKDPTSTLIADGAEFQDLVTLLKSWGVPFDIARLDQERLSPAHFLDADGRPRYGAVLWDADQTGPLLKQDYGVVAWAVRDHHIGLIALADRIKEPVIQSLLGVRFRAVHPHSSDLRIVQAHFLTRGLTDPLDAGDLPAAFKSRVQADLDGAQALVRQGDYPQVTIRELDPETRAVWIGGDPARMLSYQPVRTLLKRALTSVIGYALVKSWTDRIILMMDDLGNAQNSWLEHWHYPALTADQIRRFILAPLKAHDAVLVVNAVPGFADDKTRRVVPTWGEPFVDAFGTRQDYRSTKEGLDEGVKAGLIEIHSHGWTHMQPDLDSEPGPWWGSPADGEKAEVGWYREFFDTRRNREIPAAVQSLHMRRSIEWIERQFGTTPLAFATGGNAVSTSFAANTWRIAAREGFGWYGGYLGQDFAVQGNANATAPFGGTDDVPLILPAPPDGHDRGVSLRPEGFAEVFATHPKARFIGLDEYVGYIHASVRSSGVDFGLEIADHPRFGRFFRTHPETWSLHLSDWLGERMAGGVWTIVIDGRAAEFRPQEWTTIELAPGRAVHRLEIAKYTRSIPRAEARGINRVYTERRFYPDLKIGGLSAANVSQGR
ncbi:MAG: hypothetical protein NTZ26_07535 [Candidatus Aminicenantes bacterium]|nr:hypothetical protein [Candidatus Aminicenantes bacterium]